jgi:arylformamidase
MEKKLFPARKNFVTLIDISVPLSPTLPRYPGDPPVRLAPVRTPVEDAPFKLTRLAFGSHTGSHLDAPSHLLPGGASSAEIPLALLIGPCRVLDLGRHSGTIGAGVLADLPCRGATRLLLRTTNSGLWKCPGFSQDYVALAPDGAAWLVANGVRLVGIDYLSIEPFTGSGDVHRILLEQGVVILEGLDLGHVAAGDYELICLPLKLPDCDGAPCRAVLRTFPQDGQDDVDISGSK